MLHRLIDRIGLLRGAEVFPVLLSIVEPDTLEALGKNWYVTGRYAARPRAVRDFEAWLCSALEASIDVE
jgi:hypothetical protein